MATTYSIAPSPKWYFADAEGRPAAYGSMETFSSLDHSTQKMIFSDPVGLHPYENPMILDASGGTKVQMFWQFNEIDLYYVVIKDASGNIICTADNFPAIGGGGITPITANIDIENHLVNGQFLFIDAATDALSSVSTIPQGDIHLAPGSGFFKNTSGQYVSFIDPLYVAGWSFEKHGGVGAVDNIAFIPVADIGAGYPNSPAANATRYFQFTLSVAGTSFTDASLKNVIPNVELFSNETITVSFDCRGSAGATGTFQIIQYFGLGGSPTPVPTSQTFTFNNGAWGPRKSLTITVPSIVGKTKGTDNADCLIFKWQIPLNVLGNFRIDNLQVQRGVFGNVPYIEQTYAQDQYKVLIDLIQNGNLLFRTGDLRHSTNGNPIPGWLLLFNGAQTLGSAISGATSAGNQFKNLYIQWWDEFTPTQCVVTGGRGISALSDFNLNKKMTINQDLITTVIAAAGNSISFATFEGNRAGQLLAHSHTIGNSAAIVGTSGATFFAPEAGVGTTGITGTPDVAGNLNMQPTIYLFLFVKL